MKRKVGRATPAHKRAHLPWLTAWVLVMSAGCNGFPAAEPIREAEHKPEKYPSYAAATSQVVTVDGQRWQILPGAVVEAPTDALQAVRGTSLYTVRGAQPPLPTLFMRAADGRLLQAGELF